MHPGMRESTVYRTAPGIAGLSTRELVDFRGRTCVHFAPHRAQVAELVDALVSGTSG